MSLDHVNDLLLAFAAACPFIAIALLCGSDALRWLEGDDEIGAGETHEGEVLDDLRVGLSATLAEPAVGADYSHLDGLIDELLVKP